MIVIRDSYLNQEDFQALQDYCYNTEFKEVQAGEKSFLTIPTPDWVREKIQIEGSRMVLTFIRKAHKNFDTELRAHCDYYIMNEKVDYAVVLYINDTKGVSTNGTRFHKHIKYGYKLPENFTEQQYNDLILNHSNDETKWVTTDVIQARPNRLLMYDAQLFHSKYPSKIETGERIVLVAFYKKI